jgi:hypothetical protein
VAVERRFHDHGELARGKLGRKKSSSSRSNSIKDSLRATRMVLAPLQLGRTY